MKIPVITKKVLIPITALSLSTAAYSYNTAKQSQDSFNKECIDAKEKDSKSSNLLASIAFGAAIFLSALGYKAAMEQHAEDCFKND